jgi:hypothetical protein
VLAANPPFGRKSSMTMVIEACENEREDLVTLGDDFWASTSTSSSTSCEACEVISVSAEIARAVAVLRAAHSKLKTSGALIIATSGGRSDRVIGNDPAWIGICESFELVDAVTR